MRIRAYYHIRSGFDGRIIMDNETYLKMDYRAQPGPEYYNTQLAKILHQQTDHPFKKRDLDKEDLDLAGILYMRSAIKVWKVWTYIKKCLKMRLLPFIRQHWISTIVWLDLATYHYDKPVLQWDKAENTNFLKKTTTHQIERNFSQLKDIRLKRKERNQTDVCIYKCLHRVTFHFFTSALTYSL